MQHIARPKVIGSEIAKSQDLLRSSLSDFLSKGISPTSGWEVFDQFERVRIAYLGTEVSNLTHLIQLEPLAAATGLHHPYPPIKPPLAWRPDLDSGDRSSSLLQDICSFPAKDVRDDLVESFFTHIHPYFPIIDEYRFRKQYGDCEDPPPLLILQSVLLAGAHASQHPRVTQVRSTVMAVLFRRAKSLFDMRHENDRLHLVQAALLFTWHLENADNVGSNSWYWAGVACRIAFGIGMHRDLSKYSAGRFPEQDRRVYRRVWFCVFQVETLSALEHGRPSMIRIEDFDQLPLEIDDLRDSDGIVNSRIRYDYIKQRIELCHIALEVLRLSSPGIIPQANTGAIQAVNSRLVAWARSTVLSNDYEALNLRILYQTIVIHWHRTSINVRLVGSSQSAEICKGASKAILMDFESLVAQNFLFRFHFTEVVSLAAAAIQTHQEAKFAIDQGHALQAINAMNDLERVLRIAKALAEYWPNSEALFNLFEGLLKKLKASATHDNEFSSTDQAFNEIEDGLEDVNWHEIMSYQPLEQPLNEGWLNDLLELGHPG